jgi:hypothetical protein
MTTDIIDFVNVPLFGHPEHLEGAIKARDRLNDEIAVVQVLLEGEQVLRDSSRPRSRKAKRLQPLLAFTKSRAGNDQDERRRRQLLQLDRPSLILCGLVYTVKKIIGLPDSKFSTLILGVGSFVERKNLRERLLALEPARGFRYGEFYSLPAGTSV